ncbi:60Kd inner membrane protein [Synechococcus sp. PCC 7335]|uniref:membrane protein insertase YidC n=1 Tax=Synechococcus sp. (strain ATCC 29403 / PCC 7335) TaxID=91464 RepID=UPI00017EDFE5|nr:membrane protein insertase YidC [Synechococcus sp. PCC 7335]EDX85461.1 60Kd inner membrane protein [Synechococcus sp. PCC 7335]
MDFGIGFLSNNVMLPILDFFYGIVPSYGLAIVALTLVIRFALYPLNAGSIRNMRKMKIANPLMQKRMAEVKERYKDDPVKQQEEIKDIYSEFGNPLAGCFPVVLQMPILFALFATLRGSPFADTTLPVNLKLVPQEAIEQVEQAPLVNKPSNIFVADGEHFKVSTVVPTGEKLAVGETTKIELRSVDDKSLDELREEYKEEGVDITPQWEITKGDDLVAVQADGTVKALAPGDVTIQVKVPGLAADKGFLFIEKLGRIGVTGDNGEIHWDILGMIIFFGLSLYVSQQVTNSGNAASPDGQNDQQQAIAKFTPIIFSGMFLFFPLPAGVLMYMVIANVFQTAQSFILSREPLPENLQKLVDAQEKKAASSSGDGRKQLAFEPGAAKRASKAEASNKTSNKKGAKASKANTKTDSAKAGTSTKSRTKKKVAKKKSS